ncbi:hypothetical protein [Actinoplanes sp. HUAS TT8]|uniref:hypothetical protein n=1 Tax=Actinoplanes sp. HUAS TT8 TaxID=3447453 RepID=UPI003F525EB5
MGALPLFLEALMLFAFRLLSSWRSRRRDVRSVVQAHDRALAAFLPNAAAPDGDDLLTAAVQALDSRDSGFGAAVAGFIHACVRQQILTFDAPITGIRIEPTVSGERRDGGFLVLVTVGHVITVASDRLTAALFHDADDVAAFVLTAVCSTATSLYLALMATAADLPRNRS